MEVIVHIRTNPKHNGTSDQINVLFVWVKFLKKNVVFMVEKRVYFIKQITENHSNCCWSSTYYVTGTILSDLQGQIHLICGRGAIFISIFLV